MKTVSIYEAQSNLLELIRELQTNEELIITKDDIPIARLTNSALPSENTTPKGERKLGTMKGTVLYMAPDFDAPLDDFAEYM